jgi:hypothetical protein
MPVDVCKLCLQRKSLQLSHLIPAAVYARLIPAPNVNPVLANFDPTTQQYNMVATSQQIQDYVFCWDCEQLFREKGEDWILRHVASDKGSPLFDLLSAQTPVGIFHSPDELRIYATRDLPEFDKEKIVHFAMGIFFKAGVHRWRVGRHLKGISLGKYLEEIRKYLLGERDFPKYCALWFCVIPPTKNNNSFLVPGESPKGVCHKFMFSMLGLQFILGIGKEIPSDMRDWCFVRSSSQFVVTSEEISTSILRAGERVFASGRVYGKLRNVQRLPWK